MISFYMSEQHHFSPFSFRISPGGSPSPSPYYQSKNDQRVCNRANHSRERVIFAPSSQGDD